MNAKTKATIGLTAVLALGVGGGVTYAAAGQDQPDTVRVQTVSEDAAPVEQPSPSPSTSQAPVEQQKAPETKDEPVTQPVQQEQPAAQQPVQEAAPAPVKQQPAPKAETQTQPDTATTGGGSHDLAAKNGLPPTGPTKPVQVQTETSRKYDTSRDPISSN